MKKKNFKDIHVGSLINERVSECKIEMERICKFLKCDEYKILEMYKEENLDSGLLLKWSKLLEYDFFRVYSMHLILHLPLFLLMKGSVRSFLSSGKIFIPRK